MEREAKDQGSSPGSPLSSAEPWDLAANGYATDLLGLAEQFAQEALELASLPPAPHIVDVAAGPGTLAILAARDGATVNAIDFSPKMVQILRRRADAAGLKAVDARVGDGQNLPYRDKSFDGGFSLLGLVFFP